MNRVRQQLGASYAYERGLFGEGIGVAVLDSGIAADHPDLKGRVVYARSFGSRADTRDECGHGTHISGIIGGNGMASGGRYQGLAPRCHFLSLKVLDRKGNGGAGNVIDALHWIMEYGAEYQVRIVNISMGGTIQGVEAQELLRAVEETWNAGFVVCAAAGNQGPGRQSITVPGTSRKIITVGSSDDQEPVQMAGKKRVNYSGRGPTGACVCKPDVIAPGSYVVSCNARWRIKGQNGYCVKSGTSMATPVVSGALALLLGQRPHLSSKEVKLQLSRTCKDMGFPKNQQGWGRIEIPSLLGK